MLRPERMARVSVTGSKRVLGDTVEAVHGMDLLHLTDYDGSFDGFEPGDPGAGADEASDKLVTVRSLESILGVEPEDAGPTQLVTEEALDEELEEVRVQVNELDDRRDELRDELRDVEERIDAMEPFVRLGVDLDLLRGYDRLSVAVGEGDPDAVRRALAESEIVEFEVFAGEDVAAAVARADESELADALVGVTLTELEVPEGEGDPSSYLTELRDRRERVEAKLDTVRGELEDLRLDVAGFLLAAEETLAVEVQKREAPLSFATTDNAFVAEGWLPEESFGEFKQTLQTAVGEAIDVTKLEVAEYDEDGHVEATEEVTEGDDEVGGGPTPAAADEADADEAIADGGHARSAAGFLPIGAGEPPVVQDNPGSVKPFEALVEVINRPKYSELDPTVVLFLTFPLFFGFMIGDLGYGLLYAGLGYWITRNFESDVIRSLGGIGMWAGAFTAIFGVLYGEFFGLHALGEIVWPGGSPPIHKGLQPTYVAFAQAWLLLSVVAGTLHLVVGRVFDFVNNLHHGLREAFMESGSWIVLTVSLWWWVLSETAMNAKPPFMFRVFAREGMTNPATGETITSGVAIPLGFNGFPAIDLFGVGGIVIDLALVVAVIGLGLVIVAEGGIGLIESITQAFGHVVSYTRLAAVLLAKAGMALAVNLLVFGAYTEGGEFHFIFFDGVHGEVIFSGLVNGSGPVALILGGLAGIAVLIVGHLLVLVLGVTSAGLQAVRLEYVEFFGKFYEGGGTTYSPFGYERRYTTDE